MGDEGASGEARTSQGNEKNVPEYSVFTSHYHELVSTFSSANVNLPDYFVSESIITIEDNHTIHSKTDPHEKAMLLLKPIVATLQSGSTTSFDKMLGIMRKYGNESMRLLADKITQSLRGSEFANTSISPSSLQNVSTPTTTPAQIIPPRRIIPTDCFNTPREANTEFNDFVLSSIIQELSACISQNDQKFTSVCHYIIHKLSLLSQEDKDKITNSKSITDIKNVMDPHWNWSSHCLLNIILKNLRSTKSLEILQRFDERVNKQMKLKDIHENLQPIAQSSGYCKMIAILDLKKDYSEITLEEGLEVEELVVEYLGQIGAHMSKTYECTPPCIEMEWNISTDAVDDFCTEAMKHKDIFIARSFLCLKIGSYTIINTLPNKTGKLPVPRSSLMMVFNDPIHGHIELDPVLLKIIDTPQFQRLRYIRQLGGGYYVFPGASHNRFEHSIGVCYLAGELVETLKTKQPELGITKDDVLCVKIAGLCNNLGCGPFSDMFEKSFIPKARNDRKNWKYQEASVKMFDYLIEQNNLTNKFKPKDLEFVKELILCPPEKNWDTIGRNKDKEFLYEIVTNRRNGIDVIKFDYLARDCYHLGITSIFDHRRFMMFARVIECDGKRQICSRDKEVMNLYDMFYTRYLLHKRAYYHKTVNAVELMICEAFLKADSHVLKKSKDSKMKLSDCIDDMGYYTELTDYVFHQILFSTSTNSSMKKSKEILNKVVKRELYKYIGHTQPTSKTKYTEEEIVEQIVKCANKDDLTTDDLVVKIVTYDYGMEEKNPIDHVRFYAKDYPDQAFKLNKDHVSRVMLLKEFVEQEISVYCKRRDDSTLKAAQTAFTKWCDKAGYTVSSDSDFDGIYTPYCIPSIKSSQDSDESNLKPSESKKQRMDQ